MAKLKCEQSTSKIRFFAVPENQIDKLRCALVQDSDLLTLTTLPAIVYPYPTADEKYIVKVILNKKTVGELSDHCADYGVEDPLTIDGVVAMQLINCFAGRTREDVLAKYPELAGKIEIEIEERIVEVDKFPVKVWAFEGLKF